MCECKSKSYLKKLRKLLTNDLFLLKENDIDNDIEIEVWEGIHNFRILLQGKITRR